MPHRSPHDSTLRDSSIHREPPGSEGAGPALNLLALALVWSRDEPARLGEVLTLPLGAVDFPFTIGRAVESDDDGAQPLMFQQLRPASRVDTGPLRDARVSRRQLRVRLREDGALLVERLGSTPLRINGHEVAEAIVSPGDVIESVGRFILLVTQRPVDWPRAAASTTAFPFGGPDPQGIVGESVAAWALRGRIAFIAPRTEHVLVHGPSGTGKELVVRALHAASPRGATGLVARNAATIPDALVDAELFGNLRDYPNPGTPNRIGILGEADGGALFLDEIGELAHALQAHLLRVMDGGEYQRLGEAQRRVCNARFFAATNRDPGALKHDLLARFVHRIEVPGLEQRPEDVPLLARQLLRSAARDNADVRARFFVDDEPTLASGLVAALVLHPYTTHVRELASVLWRALAASPGGAIQAPTGLALHPRPPLLAPNVAPTDLTREQVLAALAACGGVRERAWRLLGLRSRDQLKRLLIKLDIS